MVAFSNDVTDVKRHERRRNFAVHDFTVRQFIKRRNFYKQNMTALWIAVFLFFFFFFFFHALAVY